MLFVAKTNGLIHAAYAEAGAQVAALSGDPVPSNKDYAGGEEDQAGSASEVDVLNALARRRRELDARQGQLTIQANMIAAAEKRVDAKIAQLKQLQSQIAALMGQHDEAQKAQLAALVKTYSTMKPKDAARIFNALPDDVLVPVAQQMKSDVLALVLSNMASDNAKALTVKLANKLALPQTLDAMAPVAGPAPVAAAPGPVTAAPAGPLQTAAGAPALSAKPAAPSTPPAAENAAKPKT
jgi:flagellar motility protein MotE (MotC chaperone)